MTDVMEEVDVFVAQLTKFRRRQVVRDRDIEL
jgi:hypothetical protein